MARLFYITNPVDSRNCKFRQGQIRKTMLTVFLSCPSECEFMVPRFDYREEGEDFAECVTYVCGSTED